KYLPLITGHILQYINRLSIYIRLALPVYLLHILKKEIKNLLLLPEFGIKSWLPGTNRSLCKIADGPKFSFEVRYADSRHLATSLLIPENHENRCLVPGTRYHDLRPGNGNRFGPCSAQAEGGLSK